MRRILALALALAAFVLPLAAWADIGPKPTAAWDFAFDKPGVTIASGELLQCRTKACEDAKPLQALGPQRFGCQPRACSAMAYGFADFGKLRIVLSDGRTVESNVFAIKDFNARFKVRLVGDALKVTPGG